MSAMTYRWDDPYRTGFAGTYDPGTMYGLYFRSQEGDAAAKNHLAQAGFFDQYGNDIYGAGNNYQQAVANWAKAKGLGNYTGTNPFQWNPDFAQPNNQQSFQNAWTNFWNTGQQGTTNQQAYSATGAAAAPLPVTQPNLQVSSRSVGLSGTQPPAAANGPLPPDWGQRTGNSPNAQAYWGREYNVYKPNLPTGKYYSGVGLPDHYDNTPKYTWGIKAGDRTITGVQMISTYNGNQDLMRWQNPNSHQWESTWDHWDGLTRSIARDFHMPVQQASEEALKEMAAAITAQGGDWGRSGFGAVPGISTTGNAPGQPAPGTGSGGPAAQQPTPGTTPDTAPTQGQNAGNTGDLTAAQRLMLSSDPNQAYRYMMQQIGYNPDAPGLLGKFLQQKFQPLLEARMAASGVSDNASYMDNIGNIISGFGGGLFQKGGNFYGDLANAGRQAAQQGAGYLNNLTDQEQAMQYLQQLGQLQYAGANPMIQQAMADQMKQGFNQYEDLGFTQEGQGKNIDPFQQWLLASRYRSIFGY